MRVRGLNTTLVALLLCATLSFSCGDDDPAKPRPPEPVVETHVIRDVDFIANKCFLIDHPETYAGAYPSTLRIYLTVTQQDLMDDPSLLRFPGWAICDSTADGERIDAAIDDIEIGSPPAYAMGSDFRRLERDTDYHLLTQPGDTLALGFELTTPVPDAEFRIVAVSYINGNGVHIGGQTVGAPPELILRMIKAPEPMPFGPFASTWPMMMRNAYDLGFGDIDPDHLTIRIEEANTTRTDPWKPDGSDVPYAKIFGVDRTGSGGTGPPDGKVDHVFYGWKDDLGRSILWMPTNRAFAPPPDLVQAWTDGAFEFSGVYLPQYETSQRIYNERLGSLDEQDVHQYVIKATLTTPAP